MRHFFHGDSIVTFLLISLIIHLLFFISWTPRQRAGRFGTKPVAVQLLPKPAKINQPTRKNKRITRKKTTVSKKKRIKPAKKVNPIPIRKKTVKKLRPLPARKSALATIKKRYAKIRQQTELDKIRNKLAQENQLTGNRLPAGQARIMLYAEQLKSWITKHWNLPELLAKEKLSATISLTIDAAGNLRRQQIERLSGNQLFDDSIMLAIKRAAPFPPFPASMRQSQEEFVITFEPKDITN